jgi:hypothetical protein
MERETEGTESPLESGKATQGPDRRLRLGQHTLQVPGPLQSPAAREKESIPPQRPHDPSPDGEGRDSTHPDGRESGEKGEARPDVSVKVPGTDAAANPVGVSPAPPSEGTLSPPTRAASPTEGRPPTFSGRCPTCGGLLSDARIIHVWDGDGNPSELYDELVCRACKVFWQGFAFRPEWEVSR